MSRSRVLDTRLLAEGLDVLTDSPRPAQLVTACFDAGYMSKIQHLEIDLGIFKIPTHSSDWLFMLRLGALMNFDPKKSYKSALKRHYNSQSDEHNALFEAIAQNNGIDANDPMAILDEYPLINTNREVVHKTQRRVWVKNDLEHQRKEALPVYARGTHYNVWKKNPFQARVNLESAGDASFFGIDFLLPYYLAQLLVRKES